MPKLITYALEHGLKKISIKILSFMLQSIPLASSPVQLELVQEYSRGPIQTHLRVLSLVLLEYSIIIFENE